MDMFADEDFLPADGGEDNGAEWLPPSNYAPLKGRDLPKPHLNPLWLGHEAQEKLFLELFNKGTLPHAMIFAGPQGIGKATMAFRLARFLLKHGQGSQQKDSLFGTQDIKLAHTSLDVDPQDPVFTRVASGGHPDFRYIEREFNTEKGREDTTMKVEAVRKIEPFLRMKAAGGGWRVVIIEDADTMNRNAQNAILKILEEPPPKVLLILIAHRLGALIPTIRSRARVIPFSPLASDVMENLLGRLRQDLSMIDKETLYAISGGSIGTALRLSEEGGLSMLSSITELLDATGFPDWIKIHELSQDLGQTSQDKDYRLFRELMLWLLAASAQAKARGKSGLPNPLKCRFLENMIKTQSLEGIAKRHDSFLDLFTRTELSNLDKRDAVRGGFLVISQ